MDHKDYFDKKRLGNVKKKVLRAPPSKDRGRIKAPQGLEIGKSSRPTNFFVEKIKRGGVVLWSDI